MPGVCKQAKYPPYGCEPLFAVAVLPCAERANLRVAVFHEALRARLDLHAELSASGGCMLMRWPGMLTRSIESRTSPGRAWLLGRPSGRWAAAGRRPGQVVTVW